MNDRKLRKSVRKRVSFAIAVERVIRGSQPFSIPPSYVFQGADISIGGVALHTNALIKVDDRLIFSFSLPGEKRVLKLMGRVRNVSPKPDQLGQYRVGVQFEKLEDEDQSYIANYLGSSFLLY